MPAPRKAAAAPSKPETPVGELFARRNAALDESLAVLTRKVKRALQDDQNIMLERLRDVKGMITTELEDEHAQRARYAEAALEALADAAAAGVQFAFDEADAKAGPVNAPRSTTARPTSRSPSSSLFASASSPTAAATAASGRTRPTRSGAARASSDSAPTPRGGPSTSAWSPRPRGARSASSPRRTTRPATRARSTPRRVRGSAGQNFPSGSQYPPLHAGCACAVVPA